MNINFSKKTILCFFVFLWVVFSVVYILWDVWSDFQEGKIVQSYQQGRTDTINALITEAEKCQPFSVFSAEKQIQLMNLECQQGSAE